MKMQSETGIYTGTDNLEVMREAVCYNTWLRDLVLRYKPPTGSTLDFGAGTGTFASALAASGLQPICLELDSHLRAALAAQGFATRKSLDEIEDAALDYVYSLNVLEHIADDLGALRQLHTKVRSGGTLLLYVPAFQVLYSSMDRKVGHLRRYRLKSLKKRVTSAGFDVQVAKYADSLGFFAALLYRFVGSDAGDIDRAKLRLYDRYVFPLSLFCDKLFSGVCGKNLLIVARRP